MKHKINLGILFCAVALLSMVQAQFAQADTLTFATTWDLNYKPSNGAVVSNTSGVKPIGWKGGADTAYSRFNWLIPVDLSSLAAGETLSAATLAVKLDTMNLFTGDPRQFAADLYGVGYSNSILTLPDVDDNLFYRGPDDPNHTKLMDAMVAQGSAIGTWHTASTTALMDYLNNRPSGNDVAWLRMNQDTIVTGTMENWNMGYLSDEAPTLEYTVAPPAGNAEIPEPATLGLLGIGGTLLLKRRR